jgi:carbon-monoxide dehydrogenase medium subunit
MYTNQFSYHRVNTVQEAISLLQKNPDARLLAGGHSLIPAMKLRLSDPSALVDISRVAELKGIRQRGNTLVIGAMTTHSEIEDSALLKQLCPLLPEVAHIIGDPAVRNRGTLGGSLAHADPAADYPASMLALGASMKIVGSNGDRVVDADNFFTGMFATAIGSGEILTEIHVPVKTAGVGMAYETMMHPASRYAIVGVAAMVRMSGGVCQEARVGMTGAGHHAMRLSGLEAAVTGKPLDAATLSAACKSLVRPADLLGDHFASADYRAHLVDVYAQRALAAAAGRA